MESLSGFLIDLGVGFLANFIVFFCLQKVPGDSIFSASKKYQETSFFLPPKSTRRLHFFCLQKVPGDSIFLPSKSTRRLHFSSFKKYQETPFFLPPKSTRRLHFFCLQKVPGDSIFLPPKSTRTLHQISQQTPWPQAFRPSAHHFEKHAKKTISTLKIMIAFQTATIFI